MLRLSIIFIVIFNFFVLNSYANDNDKSIQQEAYSLQDLCKIALKLSESVKIAEEDVYMANLIKKKTFAALVPSFSTFIGYSTNFGTASMSSDWGASWGVRFDQSFSLSRRELGAYYVSDEYIKKSNYDLESLKATYLLQVSSDYYNVLKAKRGVDIADINVKRLEKHKESVNARLKMETATKLDLLRVNAELSMAKTVLINADNNLRLAKSIIQRNLNLSPDYKLLEPKFSDNILIDSFNFEDLKKSALNSRTELKSLNSQKFISEALVEWDKGALWPTVSVEGLYQYNDGRPKAFFDDHDSFSIGLNLNFLFFDGGMRKAEINESQSRKRKVDFALEETIKLITIEIEQAYLEVIREKNIVDALSDQLKYVKENYEAVTQQFKYGLADSIDVMEANSLLSTTERELSDSKYNLELSILKLKKAEGLLISELTR
ncbi:MAG: TolC family protein [Desulfobacterales bacterium]|nr:TolC family protein [Desulfobacterales bacterium]